MRRDPLPWVAAGLIALVVIASAAAVWAGIRYGGDSTGVVPVVVYPAPLVHPAAPCYCAAPRVPSYRVPVYRPAVVEEPEP